MYLIEFTKHQKLPNAIGMGMVTNYLEFKKIDKIVEFLLTLPNLKNFKNVWNLLDNGHLVDRMYLVQLTEAKKLKIEYEKYLTYHEKFEGALVLSNEIPCESCQNPIAHVGDILLRGYTKITCPGCNHECTITHL